MLSDAGGCNPDRASLSSFRNSMLDRVLDDRLQNQRWNLGQKELAGNVDTQLKPLNKPRLLDLQIFLRELHLLAQRHLLPCRILEDAPHEIAQLGNHVHCCLVPPLADKPRNSAERIEEKVRLDLSSQCLKLSLREQLVQPRSLRLLISQPLAEIQQILDRQDACIEKKRRQNAAIELLEQQIAEPSRARGIRKGVEKKSQP